MEAFDKLNKLIVTISCFSVNTPDDLKKLLELLEARETELRRLTKQFDLEHLLPENRK